MSRAGRLRTDLGGVYFNLVFAVLVAGVYAASHFEPLLVVFAVVQVEVLHQFFPFVRLDGYYVASDLIGVPDLFMRIRPTLASLWPGRPLHPQVAALKPWARYAVAAWVLLTLLTVAVLYLLLVFGLPRLIGTARESFVLHAARVAAASQRGDALGAVGAGVEEGLLLLPLAALALTLARVLRYLATAGWRLGARRPAARFAVAVIAALVIGFAAGAMWSGNRYSPLRPSEHGTLRSAPVISEVVPSPASSASPTHARAPQQGSAPVVSSAQGGGTSTGGASATPAPTPAPTGVSATSAPPASNPTPMPAPTATAISSAAPTSSPSP